MEWKINIKVPTSPQRQTRQLAGKTGRPHQQQSRVELAPNLPDPHGVTWFTSSLSPLPTQKTAVRSCEISLYLEAPWSTHRPPRSWPFVTFSVTGHLDWAAGHIPLHSKAKRTIISTALRRRPALASVKAYGKHNGSSLGRSLKERADQRAKDIVSGFQHPNGSIITISAPFSTMLQAALSHLQ